VKKAWAKLSIPFDNFKIYQLEQEIELSQLGLKGIVRRDLTVVESGTNR
jgi:hypothetical protein